MKFICNLYNKFFKKKSEKISDVIKDIIESDNEADSKKAWDDVKKRYPSILWQTARWCPYTSVSEDIIKHLRIYNKTFPEDKILYDNNKVLYAIKKMNRDIRRGIK